MKVQVVFYSMYGHVHQMAEAVAAGAREIAGAEVALYQVPELIPEAALERTGDFSQTRDNSGNLFPYIRDYTLNAPCSATDQTGCFKDGGVLGKIPANRLYGLGLNILKIYPLPNTTGVGFNYITEQPSSQPQRQDHSCFGEIRQIKSGGGLR